MRTSVSNIAWGGGYGDEIAALLTGAGVGGVELAPTAIWPDLSEATPAAVIDERNRWNDAGLKIPAIQSLLFGCGDVALFDPGTHPKMNERLDQMISIAYGFGAGIAVFGSPRNRIKGCHNNEQADEAAAAFFAAIEGKLSDAGVTLTLEPNAPQYGADYLTHYADCIRLADRIGSPNIGVQIDTGCLALVNSDPAAELLRRVPQHVHASAPNLDPLPGSVDHNALARGLREIHYEHWITMEMKRPRHMPRDLRVCAEWLTATYRDTDA